MKYKVIKDYKIIPADTILEKDEKGEYSFSKEENGIVTSTVIDEDILEDTEYFDPLFKVSISNEDLDDSTEKNWKVVFNIKCTEKELLRVQKVIKDNFS